MRIVMMACTERGFSLMRRTAKALELRLPGAEIIQEGRCARVPGYEDGPRLSQSTEKWFSRADALVFFSAAGIAVRCIAPFVKDKFTDPAVIVMDEGGNFSISLLSGHVGGANRLCRILAGETGAIPVITTATDTQGRFAVDEFAAENGLHIGSREAAKRISAAAAAGEKVKIYADPASGVLLFSGEATITEKGGAFIIPEGTGAVITRERSGAEVIISFCKMPQDRPDALYLIPRLVTLGIGCRKGTEAENIRETVEELLRKNGIFREALCGVATIDLKKEETGLIAFSDLWNLPPAFYTAGELCAVPGVFSESAFVRETTGVGNVCERSAVKLAMDMLPAMGKEAFAVKSQLSGSKGMFCLQMDPVPGEAEVRLLAKKLSRNGVTAALACCVRPGRWQE